MTAIVKARPLWASALALVLSASVHGFVRAPDAPTGGPKSWFVSTKGSDANAGSESRPFKTIQHAADVVSPGDTVIVEDGVYTGTGAGTPCAPGSKPIVCVARGGTISAPVTFRARHPFGAKLDGQGNTSTDGIRVINGASYVEIEGFEIYGVGNASGSSSGIELYRGGQGSVVRGNNIHDIGHVCTGTTNGEVGVFVEQPEVTVIKNRIHDIGRYMIGENGCTVGYSGSTDHGVYVNGNAPGANGIVIADNVFYNNKRGWSVQLYPGTLERVRILNNTFAYPNPYQDGQIVLGASTLDSRIENNVFYSPRTAAIYYYRGTQTRLLVRNNTVAGASLMTTIPPGVSVEGNRTVPAMAVSLP